MNFYQVLQNGPENVNSKGNISGIFHTECISKCSQTLLGMPPSVDVADKCNGKYIYHGFKSGILTIFQRNTKENVISVDVDKTVECLTILQFWQYNICSSTLCTVVDIRYLGLLPLQPMPCGLPILSGEDPKHVDPEFASPLKNGRKKKEKYQSISGTPA